jgi:lysyl-tRNA synthetase class 2
MSTQNNDIKSQRIEKIESMRAEGIEPYPHRYERHDLSSEVSKNFDENKPVKVKMAGRIKSKRVMGKASFGNIEDHTGLMQFYFARDSIGEENYTRFKTFDLGDIVGVEGETFLTKKGEKSVRVEK